MLACAYFAHMWNASIYLEGEGKRGGRERRVKMATWQIGIERDEHLGEAQVSATVPCAQIL